MKTSIKSPWGDAINTVIHCKSLDSWYNEHAMLDYNYFKLPQKYSFNLDEMNGHIDGILSEHSILSIPRNRSGKKYNRYGGLGFLAREQAIDPLGDHFTRRDKVLGEVYPDDLHLNNLLPALYEDDFTSPTSILTEYFKQVFSVFLHHISKASLLELRSNGFLGSHVDFPYYKGIRLHATLRGGENSWYEIAGEKFQIPADGNWYFIDTGKYHSIWNNGPDNRLTINVNLSDILTDPLTLAMESKL